MSEQYRPLPEGLTIRESEIEGLGLFATHDIPKDHILGVTHVSHPDLGILRTPLGGHYNHSEEPNCTKEEINVVGLYFLKPIRDIKKGEELTVKYTFYDPS